MAREAQEKASRTAWARADTSTKRNGTSMKLRNKKTGEIGELHYYPDKAYHFAVSAKDPTQTGIYKKPTKKKEEK